MTVFRIVKGSLFCVTGLLAGTLGVFVYGGLLLPIFFIRPNLYRNMFDYMLASYSHFLAGLLEIVMGVKIKITGDLIRPGERNLILMNHRTRLDWMYFWSVLIRQSGVSTEKVILKSALKKLPGLGWAMQVGAFIFIERKWEEDKNILNKMIDYYSNIKHRTQILLFPEGTDLTDRTKAKSDEFARKNDVDAYNYVLHPRTTGFTYITQHMRQKDHLDAVYDVTIAYPYSIPQREVDLVTGKVPEEVHFHVKRHAVQSLPITEEGLQNWCKKQWQEKEERLKSFYEKLYFDETIEGEECKHSSETVVNGDSKCIANSSHQRKLMDRKKRDLNARTYMWFAIISWTSFIIGITLLLIYTSSGIWIAFGQVVFFTLMTVKYRGFEFFQVDYYNKFFRVNNTKKLK